MGFSWGKGARYLGFLAAGGCRGGRLLGARWLPGQPVHAVLAGAARRDHRGGAGTVLAPGGTARLVPPAPCAGWLSSASRGLPSSRGADAPSAGLAPTPALPTSPRSRRRRRARPAAPATTSRRRNGRDCRQAWVSGLRLCSLAPEKREAGRQLQAGPRGHCRGTGQAGAAGESPRWGLGAHPPSRANLSRSRGNSDQTPNE